MSSKERTKGFSLVEVTVALAIVTFATFALIGMFMVGLQSGTDSKQRFQAATIAESICSTVRASPTTDFSSSTVQPNFPLPVLTKNANNFAAPLGLTWDGQKTASTSVTDPTARFGLLYSIMAPTSYTASINPGVSTVYMYIYWPAAASPWASGTGHYEITTTFALP